MDNDERTGVPCLELGCIAMHWVYVSFDLKMSLGFPGSRGWTEPKPRLWAKTKIGSCSIRIQKIPAYRLQLSGRKQEEYILPVHSFKKWKVKVKAKEYSSCFLPESCSRYTGIFCILIEQEPILVIAQSFGFGSVQPLDRGRSALLQFSAWEFGWKLLRCLIS